MMVRVFFAPLRGRSNQMTLQQLYDKRAAVRQSMADMVKAAEARPDGQQAFSEEEKRKFDAFDAEQKQVGEQIERRQKLDEFERGDGRVTKPEKPGSPDLEDRSQPKEPESIPATAKRFGGTELRCFKDDRQAYSFMASVISGPLRHYRDINQTLLQRCDDFASRNGFGPREMRALNETVNTAGGYTVHTEFIPQIIKNVETYGVFRNRAQRVPMASDKQLWPIHNTGFTHYYVAENAEITSSDPAFGQAELSAKKLAILTKISSELSEDTMVALGDYLGTEASRQIAYAEDLAGFTGDGTSTYGGIRGVMTKIDDGNHAGSIYEAASGNTSFAELDLVDFEGALGKLPEYAAAAPDCAWYISRIGFFASMQNLMNAAGGNTIDHLALLNGSRGLQFLGIPVVISQVMNATTGAQTSTAILFVGSLRSAALFGDRRALSMSMTSDRYWELDQIGIKWTSRYDINVHSLGDGSTAGPLVALKTPGS